MQQSSESDISTLREAMKILTEARGRMSQIGWLVGDYDPHDVIDADDLIASINDMIRDVECCIEIIEQFDEEECAA